MERKFLMSQYPRIATLKTPESFKARLDELNLNIPFDSRLESGPESPLAQTLEIHGKKIGNRCCILPMEGWDCELDGNPSELTYRRWRNFGLSGAKFIWGGEAAAVRHDGRSNTRQLMITEKTLGNIAKLRESLVKSHIESMGSDKGLYIGLQLTHSGRFSKPNDDHLMESRVAYRHPLLEKRYLFHEKCHVMTDREVRELIQDYIKAAGLAQKAGFDFVDVKHCHGYLGHEFLSAVDREGEFGGSFENRTRFFREIVEGIQTEAPGMEIGVRLSIYDYIPFKKDADGKGIPETWEGKYPYAFGGDGTGTGYDLTEPLRFLDLMESYGIRLLCATIGSPYYVPHLQRPALFPPSDGYQLLEDPLIEVAKHIEIVRKVKELRPQMVTVGSGLTYLQEWFPRVAQALVRNNQMDFAGMGRMVLAYPEMYRDILMGNELQKKKICRTFSDCTTAPRKGLVSGCYPLDAFYKGLPEWAKLKELK